MNYTLFFVLFLIVIIYIFYQIKYVDKPQIIYIQKKHPIKKQKIIKVKPIIPLVRPHIHK